MYLPTIVHDYVLCYEAQTFENAESEWKTPYGVDQSPLSPSNVSSVTNPCLSSKIFINEFTCISVLTNNGLPHFFLLLQRPHPQLPEWHHPSRMGLPATN